ncbi:hypothetical protein [Rhodoplanes elegans]|uniref:hypothetical protein n=1 Tax=Rhodoplanes elegans TaxID=29408 RepID=UPI001473D847|nr:hypothetical protein [Rhodoplanes elegans]
MTRRLPEQPRRLAELRADWDAGRGPSVTARLVASHVPPVRRRLPDARTFWPFVAVRRG